MLVIAVDQTDIANGFHVIIAEIVGRLCMGSGSEVSDTALTVCVDDL